MASPPVYRTQRFQPAVGIFRNGAVCEIPEKRFAREKRFDSDALERWHIAGYDQVPVHRRCAERRFNTGERSLAREGVTNDRQTERSVQSGIAHERYAPAALSQFLGNSQGKGPAFD